MRGSGRSRYHCRDGNPLRVTRRRLCSSARVWRASGPSTMTRSCRRPARLQMPYVERQLHSWLVLQPTGYSTTTGPPRVGVREASLTGGWMNSGPQASVTVATVLGKDEAIGSAMGPRVCVRVRVRVQGWLPGPSTRLHPAASAARRQVDMMWTGL